MHWKSVSLNIGSLADSDPDARTIFVSGLDWTVGEPELQEHFGLIGQIIRITVLKDRFTGCSKGCAYIQVKLVSRIHEMNLFFSSTPQWNKRKWPVKRLTKPIFIRRKFQSVINCLQAKFHKIILPELQSLPIFLKNQPFRDQQKNPRYLSSCFA